MHYVIIVIMAIEVKFISSKNFTSKIILNLKTFKFHNYDFKTIGLFTTSSAPISLALKSYLKRFMLYGRQCVFQVTGKSAFSAMNNYKSQALKM